jgi:hypothetical protein
MKRSLRKTRPSKRKGASKRKTRSRRTKVKDSHDRYANTPRLTDE